MGAVSWVLPGRSSECNPAPARICGRGGIGLSIRDDRRPRKKLSAGSPLLIGSLEPLSGVYASKGTGRYEESGGVTDLGEYFILGGFGITASFESSKVIGALVS